VPPRKPFVAPQNQSLATLEERLIREAVERLQPEAASDQVADYFDDPTGFVLNGFNWKPNEKIHAYQADVLNLFLNHDRVAIRGLHGLGKTTLEAWLILWFVCTREAKAIDWKVPTTAGSWHQLTHFLWPEIRKWGRRLRTDWQRAIGLFEGETLLLLNIRLHHGEAFAVASNQPGLIEGAHATQLLYAFDEAKSIQEATWDAAEGAFSGGGSALGSKAYAFAASTPGEPSGRFYDIHRGAQGYEDWKPRHIKKEEAIAAGQVSRAWCEQRAMQWGVESAIYQNRVEGEFASSDADAVIPLMWVEMAQQRLQEWKTQNVDFGPMDQLGVDVGGGGNKSVFAPRHGSVVPRLIRSTVADTMVTVAKVQELLNRNPTAIAMIDAIGIGAGVLDRLRQLRYNVYGFVAGAKSPYRDLTGDVGFADRRAEGWWRLRERLDPSSPDEPVGLPNDDTLTQDLTAPHYWEAGGRYYVESKENIARRLGRSTDDGDAVVQSFTPPVTKPKRPFFGASAGVKPGIEYQVR
jgi:hypothetical protein